MLKDIKKEHLTDYLFGYLSKEDQERVESALAQDGELLDEFNKIQDALAGFGGAFAKEPSAKVKENIFKEIGAEIKPEPKVISKEEFAGRAPKRFPIFSVAASLALLVSLGINYYFSQEIEKSQETVNYLQSEREELQTNLVDLTQTFQKTQHDLENVKTFNAKTVTLKGTDLNKDALAEVFWNKETRDVFLHKCFLPKAPDGHQHQLWALVDGNPVDMGVFSNEDSDLAIQYMGNIDKADAFAITIETEGGNPTPNLEMLLVVGEI